jgi:hypothetical protein
MLTNDADLGDFGFGFRSIGRGLKKGFKATVVNPTKFVVKKTVVEPGKIVGKSAVGVTKSSVAVGTNVARGRFKEAGKAAVRVALAPGKLAVDTTKHAAGTAMQVSKAVTNLALKPVRAKLNTLKGRRARKLAWDNRQSTVPNSAESAQARKDVKAMLSRKGPHGKMLAWLAGGPMLAGQLGVVGYDDAAIAAVATALVATAAKIIQDAAKSKFAPADAARSGASAGLVTAAQTIAPTEAVVAPAAPVEEIPAAAPVTQDEVAVEPAAQAEEQATEAETEALEGGLRGAGMFGGFAGATDDALAPATMEETTARRIASAAQRMVCMMSAPALAAIGGLEAVNAAGTLCRAVAAGDEAAVRMVLPVVVQIAARASNEMAARTMPIGVRQSGYQPNDGFGAAHSKSKQDAFRACVKFQINELDASPSDARYACQDELQGAGLGASHSAAKQAAFRNCVKFQINELEASPSDARYACQDELQGMDPSEIGMLAAFDGADPEQLAFALSGVGPEDLAAASDAAAISTLSLLPMGAAVLAGLWMAFR